MEAVDPPELAPPELAPPELAPPVREPSEGEPPDPEPPEPDPPELEPPELAPPEFAPPKLDPPKLEPPDLPGTAPPALAPPDLAPPELDPPVLAPPEPSKLAPPELDPPEFISVVPALELDPPEPEREPPKPDAPPELPEDPVLPHAARASSKEGTTRMEPKEAMGETAFMVLLGAGLAKTRAAFTRFGGCIRIEWVGFCFADYTRRTRRLSPKRLQAALLNGRGRFFMTRGPCHARQSRRTRACRQQALLDMTVSRQKVSR